MGTLVDILNQHREDLKSQGEWQRQILTVWMLLTVFTSAVALYTWGIGRFPFPVAQEFLSEHKNITFSAANFCAAAAFGSAFQIWRMRQTRIKTLIAEAFLMENDPDTALRLILELQVGDTAWLNEQLHLLSVDRIAGDSRP